MMPFEYLRPASLQEAIELAQVERAMFVAGGTTLLDLMKENVERPAVVIDLNHVPGMSEIAIEAGALRIGALVRNSDVTTHPGVVEGWPLLARAIEAGASPQLRNMATVGGNLLQRTRCPYFRNVAYAACNKRAPGSGCAALAGHHRNHAVLGTSEACIATHPSDMAVAMIAYDGDVRVVGTGGTRDVPLADFHRLPGTTPERETVLQPGEVITSVRIHASPLGARASYVKVRDRASYEFALAAAGAVLVVANERIVHARIGLGGVATVPWRPRAAEEALIGEPLTRASFERAAELAFRAAQPRPDNAYKVELGRRTLVRALETV
ncbi:MAG: xanthine dehydrogenase family protein subunit M [Kofleriaceae bacterium]